jgi:hypothetical protein
MPFDLIIMKCAFIIVTTYLNVNSIDINYVNNEPGKNTPHLSMACDKHE